MKKIFNILGGIGILALSTISCTFAYTQEQRDAYQWAYSYGITTQPTIEAANLDGNLTRQAFAKMVVNYLENVAGIKQTVSNSCSFPDENKITNDLKPYVKKTCAYQIMGSNGTNFNPTNIVNRAQLGTVLSRILWGGEYNVSGKDYYIYHLNALKFNGIMNKIDNPQTYAKRGDVLIMLKRIYEKYGSNIYMNGYQDSSYTTPITNININDNTTNNTITNQETTYNEDNTVSNIYSNSNVVYTGEDGTKYVYDDNFLNVLMDTAKEKGENDLYKFLEIEASYYKDGLDQIANLDMDELAESLGIDEDLDPDNLTAKEKSELLKKVKEGISKVIKENKDRNEEYLDKLEKVTKNINNSDKFGLKEKYNRTKGFVDSSISFLDLYSETILNLLELTLTSEDGEIDDGEGMAIAFTLIGIALAYQGEAQDYQSYLEEWATNTIKLLGGELDTDDVNFNERKYDNIDSRMSAAETRARDVSRKNDLSQIQTAIITSLQDKGVWPGIDKGATTGIPTSNIEKELMYAGMRYVPTDPINSNINYGLGENNTVKGDYLYIVAKRNGVKNGGFVLMSKQESAGSSNRIVCENKSGLDNGYITNDTDLTEVTPCNNIKQGNSCSAKACTYTNDAQLRYILIY